MPEGHDARGFHLISLLMKAASCSLAAEEDVPAEGCRCGCMYDELCQQEASQITSESPDITSLAGQEDSKWNAWIRLHDQQSLFRCDPFNNCNFYLCRALCW